MLEIRVLTGLYQGAVFPLLDETLVIGASDDCDLTVSDTGVCDFHLTLLFNGAECIVDKKEGEVLGLANERLAVGHSLLLKSPFRIGSVWLIYTDSNDEWLENPFEDVKGRDDQAEAHPSSDDSENSQRDFSILSHWKVGAAIVISLPAVLFLLVAFTTDNSSPSVLELQPPTPTLNVEDSLAKLTSMLDERGLNLAVDTQIVDEQKIIMSGELTTHQYGVFKRMLRRFQHDYTSLVSVIDDTQLLSTTLPFGIVTVVGGPHSHVVTDGGDFLFIGDEKEGFRLSEIRHDTVFFVGPSEVTLPW
ncbi:FHA domain-containing protein [Vibrio coralliilyticus]|uniref:EscD/YscD/HrpQ family type III secretion system inner membrane ring protein n=1 Tax=Vibrio coralliilyticus TaxID=190893 RepID=A0AAP6ZTN7_9VIBR|nr:FHA domain-containing protein [Vibrio coralliilyticus]NOJ24288.1 hypothetical protein [Vibrio coralliilyticus]